MPHPDYRGRFAPSPTGPLHAGSLVAALASWLDARAHGGTWLVRIEDVDTPRCVPGADRQILAQLAACGLTSDEPVLWQSQRATVYQQALDTLVAARLAYPCGCSRKAIEAALAAQGWQPQRHAERPYPGTCRSGLHGKSPRAWRLRSDFLHEQKTGLRHVLIDDSAIKNRATEHPIQHPKEPPQTPPLHWHDRRLGAQQQDVAREVGDFILQRADGLWAYQLAVVVDDAAQRITDVVRGQDLADNTPRQILLQRALALPTPRYLHTTLVRAANGEKLSKQTGAPALDTRHPLACLRAAGQVLGLPEQAANTVPEWLAQAVAQWRAHLGL